MLKVLYTEFGQNPFKIADDSQKEKIPKNQELTLVSWNVYKFNKKSSREDLKRLSNEHGFMCLQEITYSPYDFDFFKNGIGLGWNFAFSFFLSFRERVKSGVANGSVYKSIETGFIESIPKVPIIHAPKMAVITKHEIEDSKESLLVINAHIINFARGNKFDEHINQIMKIIYVHKGPVILAGDFNTWNGHRTKYLLDVVDKLGLSETKIENESRYRKLDHIFTRGVKVKKYSLINEIKSSDHIPVLFKFEIE